MCLAHEKTIGWCVKLKECSKNNDPLKYHLGVKMVEKHYLEMLKVSRGDRVLDIGCGLGYFTEILAEKGATVVGLDIDIKNIAVAKRYRNVVRDYVVGDATNLPFKESTFDKILMSAVIEHIRNDKKAIQETVQVTRNAGEIVISTHCLHGPLPQFRLCHTDIGPECHVRNGYTTREIKNLLEKNGVKVEEVRYNSIFISKLLMDFIKFVYAIKFGKSYRSQSEIIMKTTRSKLFYMYKKVFPLILFFSRSEELLSSFFKGHGIILRGKVEKRGNLSLN